MKALKKSPTTIFKSFHDKKWRNFRILLIFHILLVGIIWVLNISKVLKRKNKKYHYYKIL